jgi:hypothetical protein
MKRYNRPHQDPLVQINDIEIKRIFRYDDPNFFLLKGKVQKQSIGMDWILKAEHQTKKQDFKDISFSKL